MDINWATGEITVYTTDVAFMTDLGGSKYEMDTDAFRLAVLDREDDTDGIVWPKVFSHNTQVDLGGVQYARVIEMLSPYTITFDDNGGATQYAVTLNGSNNNFLDRLNVNSISVRSTNSAGLINVKELQHGIFSNGVWVDQTNGISGITYPIGTPLQAVNNFQDAVTIAGYRGFSTLYIVGNAILDTGDDVTNFELIGQNAIRSTITINAGAETLGCTIKEATVTGNLDGGTLLERCVIYDLNYINGFVFKCMLAPGTISLGGVSTAFFLDCYSGTPGQGTPTVDMNGVTNDQDTPLAFRNYSGGIKLIQKTGTGSVSMDFNSGQLKIDSTCVAGSIIVRGDAKVVDENGVLLSSGVINGGLTLDNETTSGDLLTSAVASAVWQDDYTQYTAEGTTGHLLNYLHYTDKCVYCDPEALVNGNGSQEDPYDNITDALDHMEGHGIDVLHLKSDIILDRNVKNIEIKGVGVPEVDANGKDLKNSEFHRIKFKGLYTQPVIVQESVLLAGAYLNGFFENCAVAGNVTAIAGATTYLKNCASSMPNGFTPNFSIGAGALVNIAEYYGKIRISSVSDVSTSVILNMANGIVDIDASCTSGTILITGNCVVNDSSLGATVINNSISGAKIDDLHAADYNRRVHDKIGNTITIYDADGITPRTVFDTNADVSEINPQ